MVIDPQQIAEYGIVYSTYDTATEKRNLTLWLLCWSLNELWIHQLSSRKDSAMVASSETARSRTEAYERMRVSEDRVRALRNQSAAMKQSMKSSKKAKRSDSVVDSPSQDDGMRTPLKGQASVSIISDGDGYPAPMAIQYSLLDSKQYT